MWASSEFIFVGPTAMDTCFPYLLYMFLALRITEALPNGQRCKFFALFEHFLS